MIPSTASQGLFTYRRFLGWSQAMLAVLGAPPALASSLTSPSTSTPSTKTEIFIPEIANHVPHLILAYDPAVVGITPKQVQELLRSGGPQIELNPAIGATGRMGTHSNENTIVVGTWMLQPGEAEIVGRQLHAVLAKTKS